ncbi:sulfatase-like hydrolase/transferase [Alienimonas chondri]|uniref:Arylsulfatase n=1 Tax=Alienimonas chondri TaxID=2681879 RepID=A0ABX1V6U6_9PLAN|nr:sulfatase-like hydrolase/transferase [Alienimonas chondri]NNJ24010.1 Arylsulfatase [Alienimonas chondri]
MRSFFSLASLVLLTAAASAGEKPNVVVLYADDAGYADFGFQPNCTEEMRNLTPRIDSIARDGARFTNAYMSGCVCSPSRAGLMTGRYQQRFGFDDNLPPGRQDGLELTETFGVKRLQSLGYRTGLIGKWHLGYPSAYHPNKRGFDHFYGLLQGSRPYYPIEKPSEHRVIQKNGEPTPESGYVTDRLGAAACRFIEERDEEPFYLFVSFTAPHGPLQPKEADAARIAHIKNDRRRKYAGLVVSLDDNVGRILDCLEEQGLTDDTLVLFTNDNGGQTQTGAVNTPLRGRKGQLHEGGIRVPWAVRWPGRAPAGSVVEEPVIALDLLPTVVEAAGAAVDPAWKLDGRSFLSTMTGGDDSAPLRPLYWRHHGGNGPRAMRLGQWKLYDERSPGAAAALYDLDADISESSDLAAGHPDRVASMIAALDEWESEMEEPRWGPNEPGRRNGAR